VLALTAAQQIALQSRRVKRRIFIWFDATLNDGFTPHQVGFWDDVGIITVSGRSYYGSGNVIQVATLSAKSDLSIPGLTIVISGIAAESVALVRGYQVSQRPVTVSLGIWDMATDTILAPLIQRFIGIVDGVEIHTGEAGGASNITLTCESIARALTIRRTETRSSGSLKQRYANDMFYDYTSGQAQQALYFGKKAPTG